MKTGLSAVLVSRFHSEARVCFRPLLAMKLRVDLPADRRAVEAPQSGPHVILSGNVGSRLITPSVLELSALGIANFEYEAIATPEFPVRPVHKESEDGLGFVIVVASNRSLIRSARAFEDENFVCSHAFLQPTRQECGHEANIFPSLAP